MKLYEQASGLWTRGRLGPGHVEALREIGVGRTVGIVALAYPDEDVARLAGERYHVVQFRDGPLTSTALTAVEVAVTAVVSEWLAGGVIVHCQAGRNRACFIAALAMMRAQGISGAEALERVRAVRRNAVSNEDFEWYILEQDR